MEKFYLEEPSLQRKQEIIDYMQEFIDYSSEINGVGGLDKVFEGESFESVLERALKMKDKDYAKSINRCPGKTFFLIRENDNKIIGSCSLRWDLTEEMLRFNGHIGYGIRPTERRKGYNKINLYLALIEAQKQGLDKVMLGCDVNNYGSDKTIRDLGGVLERTEMDTSDNTLSNVYWINVDESLEKYYDEYSKYIK